MDELQSPVENPPPPSRLPVILGTSFALVACAALGVWLMQPPAPVTSTPARPQAASVPSSATRPAPAAPAAPSAATPPARPRTTTPVEAEPAREPALAAPAPVAPARELIVDADVAGALVFLDRRFLGNAPLRTSDVPAGTHQLNVSAEGLEGVAQTVEIAESGATSLTIKLKEVRLEASVLVVHKHGMGSCQGMLFANTSGIRYVPEKGNDGFTIALAAVEGFEIDYMKKNLRLKQKGGKTWNFESPTGSADPLFVFHRDVDKARTKLAAN